MERTLQVLDYAILVISATDGVQGPHGHPVAAAPAQYQIPTFLFVTKMDLPNGPAGRPILAGLQAAAGRGVRRLDSTRRDGAWAEGGGPPRTRGCWTGTWRLAAVTPRGRARRAGPPGRRLFPCYFGAALRLEGVAELSPGPGHGYTEAAGLPPDFARPGLQDRPGRARAPA